jgi:hypothetical protein
MGFILVESGFSCLLSVAFYIFVASLIDISQVKITREIEAPVMNNFRHCEGKIRLKRSYVTNSCLSHIECQVCSTMMKCQKSHKTDFSVMKKLSSQKHIPFCVVLQKHNTTSGFMCPSP